jgi:eukaryotic-like serine/threonine-protein kinase
MQDFQKGQCMVCKTLVDFSGFSPLSVIKCPECGAELIVPWKFGNYMLTEKEKKESAFFNFYLGYTRKKNQNVRVGILKKDIPEYNFWLEQCEKEIKFIKTLVHENVMSILDSGLECGYFYYSEPCPDGFSINEYDPNKVGELEVESVLEFGKKLAGAIDAIHYKEFIHHNIEPKNIFIEKNGVVKILDLFLSRIEYFYVERNGSMQFAASPYYISPEKAEKGKEDKMGDVFSFGVFLYYFLTGKYPYDGETNEEIVFSRVKRKQSSKISEIEYVFPEHIVAYRGEEIREKIAELIERLLKPYPVQRPAAGEFVSELRLIEAEEDRLEAEEKRKHFLDHTKSVKIPMMEKLSDEK